MISVDIITGFLGAGKTTLINKLLAEAYAGERSVIIENEFGDVGIDDSLIENPEIQVRLLASGCICCTLTLGFVEGVAEVAEKYHPTRIIVEPTGLANPADVLAACTEAAKRVPLKVRTLITVVNAENIIPLLTVGGELFHKQIEEAEMIVLSCTQLLGAGEIADVKLAVRELNPLAPILEEDWKALDALTLLSLAEEARARKSGEVCPVCGHTHEQHKHENEHEHEKNAPGRELDQNGHEQGHRHHHHDHDHGHEQGHRHHHHDHDHGHEHGHRHHHHDHDHGHEHGHEHEHEHDHGTEGYSAAAFFPEHAFSPDQANQLLAALPDGACGDILRAKGFLRKSGGGFYRAEYVYGRGELQEINYNGQPKFVVIGRDLDEAAISALIEKDVKNG